MRSLVVSLAFIGLAVPAAAQQRGSLALDAMTTPGRHFGAGFYITDALSLRPSLGFAYSGQYGATFNLGTDVRYEFLTGSRVTPYVAGSYNYLRSPYLTQSVGSVVRTDASNVARFGGGGGMRTRITDRFSLFADGRVMNSQIRNAPGNAFGTQQVAENGAHFEGALGLTFLLK